MCGEGNSEKWFDKQCVWKVGIWNKVKFCNDKWLGEAPLRQKFPRLFSISKDKDKVIEQIGRWTYRGCEWNLEWRRERFEWEREQQEQLMREIDIMQLKS